MREQSRLMQLFNLLGLHSIAWGLRKFHTPVSKKAMVLEVGSGGNPYPRANILLDAYETTRERHWAPLTADRPTVLGFVENLPFKDKTFDYVIASHVLEHSSNPDKFISELQRVAKAGYIEVPDAFLERVNPYKDHRLEISLQNGFLNITKKKNWIHDPEVVQLYESRIKKYLTKILIPKRPFEFHVRYYWSEKIKYIVNNPEVDANWAAPANDNEFCKPKLQAQFRGFLRNFLRDLFSQRQRNMKIDIVPFLRCTNCHGDMEKKDLMQIKCKSCGEIKKIRNGLFVMNE